MPWEAFWDAESGPGCRRTLWTPASFPAPLQCSPRHERHDGILRDLAANARAWLCIWFRTHKVVVIRSEDLQQKDQGIGATALQDHLWGIVADLLFLSILVATAHIQRNILLSGSFSLPTGEPRAPRLRVGCPFVAQPHQSPTTCCSAGC
jgi:hypothetical protein